MKPKIWNLIFTILGAVIGIVGSFILARYNRKRDAKDIFLVFISQQRVRIDTILHFPAGQDFHGFYVQSRKEIADAVARVRPFLSCSKQSRIDALWKEYDQIPQQEMEGEYENGVSLDFDKKFPKRGTVEQPSKRLLRYMKEFEDVAR